MCGADGFKACIAAEKTRNPNLAGTVTLTFVISNEGTAVDFKILEAEVNDGIFADCMNKVVAKLRWRKFSGVRKYVEFPIGVRDGDQP